MREKNTLSGMKRRARIRLSVAFCQALSLLVMSTGLGKADPTQDAAEARSVEFVGHHDLQGRDSLQVTAKGG